MKITGAAAVLEIIKENNIDTVFGYPGGSILPIYDELCRSGRNIRHIRGAGEQGSAHAADAYARVSGKTGVVFATSGPGATNLVTALATAQADSSPLVAITGNTVTDKIGRDSFQEVYITGITMPVTKHNFVIRRANELVPSLRRAFEIAREGRCGAVLVDIPKNILTSLVSYTPKKQSVPKIPHAKKSDINKLAKLINNSERPLIYFGGGIISAGACGELYELCSRFELPACHSLMGTGALPHDFRYNIGLAGMHGSMCSAKIIGECDLLIALGTRFSDRVAGEGSEFAHEAKRVHIDIDDAEISKNIRISLGIQADAKQVLSQLCTVLSKKDRHEWLSHIKDAQRSLSISYPASDAFSPTDIIGILSKTADENAVIVTDVGQHQMWTAQLYPFRYPKTFVTSGGLGTMGFGMGAAVGVCEAHREKQVFLITGDGSFHMDLNELSTAVRYKLPVKIIIMNNASLGMVRQWQHLYYGGRYTETDELSQTDFVMLARAFGAGGVCVRTREEYAKALKEAVKSDMPYVIDCRVGKDFEVMPLIDANGSDIIMR